MATFRNCIEKAIAAGSLSKADGEAMLGRHSQYMGDGYDPKRAAHAALDEEVGRLDEQLADVFKQAGVETAALTPEEATEVGRALKEAGVTDRDAAEQYLSRRYGQAARRYAGQIVEAMNTSDPDWRPEYAEDTLSDQSRIARIHGTAEDNPATAIRKIFGESSVDIGKRDPTVSTGDGIPTAKEEAMLKEQRRLVEEHMAKQKPPETPDFASASSEEVDAWRDAVRAHDKNLDQSVFGERTEEYRRAQRTANSTNRPAGDPRLKEADAKIAEMEDALTDAQRDILYGKNLPKDYIDPDAATSLRNTAIEIDSANSGSELARASSRVIQGAMMDASRGKTIEGRQAQMLQRVMQRAKQLNVAPKELVKLAFQHRAGIEGADVFELAGTTPEQFAKFIGEEPPAKPELPEAAKAEAIESPQSPEAKPAGTVAEKSDVRGKADTLIARSKPKLRADVDHGTRYAEWRIRKVTPEDYNNLSEGQRSRGDANVGDFKVERRIIKTQEGGPTETGEWETASYGKTKAKAVEGARHSGPDYADAESLSPEHENFVKEQQTRKANEEARRQRDLVEQAKQRERDAAYVTEVAEVPLKGSSREIEITTGEGPKKVEAMVYGDWGIRKVPKGSKDSEYVITHIPSGLGAGKSATLGGAKTLVQGFIHSGVDVSKAKLDIDALRELANVAQNLPDGRAPTVTKKVDAAGNELPNQEPLPPAQMKPSARIAELEGAGVSTVNGKPLKDANAAEIINAVGKLRRGQLEETGPKEPHQLTRQQYRDREAAGFRSLADMDGGKDIVGNPNKTPEQIKEHRSAVLKSAAETAAGKNTVVDTMHRKLVEKALEKGKTVPPEVLADYPELGSAKKPDIIDRLKSAKRTGKGKIYSAPEALFDAAHDAAIDIAILAIRAGRKVADAVAMAMQRFRAKYPNATPEQVARVQASINSAVSEPTKTVAPESKPSLLPESLKAAGAPAETINYEVRGHEARKQEASDIIKRDGAAKAEEMITSSELSGDTKVAIGGQLINDKMLSLAKATPEEAAKLAKDIQRITAKMQPKLATEAGQTISMFGGIYDDVRTATAMEYIRDAQGKRMEKMGGEEGGKAADEAAKIFNKTKDPAARDKEIEKLKERYTTKPVRRMLDQLKRMEVANKLNDLGVLTRDDMVEVAGNALGIPGISQKRLKHIAELADRVHNAKNHAERSRAELELSDTLNIYKGVSPLDLEASILTLNILSGPTTQAANILGNTLQSISQLGFAALANPTKVRALVDGILEGIPEGITQAKSILATGRGSRDLADKTGGSSNVLNTIDYAEDYPSLPKHIADALTKRARIVEKISRAMKAADAVFYYPAREAYARLVATKLLEGEYKGDELDTKVDQLLHTTTASFESARQQAEGEGYTGIDLGRRVSDIIEERRAQTPNGSEAVKQSERFGGESTYNQEPVGLAGVIYRNLARTSQEANIGGVPILKPWTMFLKIPANVFNETTNFTPIGGVRATFGMQGAKYRKGGVGEGQWRNFNRDERNRLYLKSIVGTTLMAGLVARSIQNPDDTPIVSANGPQDTSKRRQLMNAGWKPYSIRVGDKWISYRDSPLLVPLAVAGHVSDSLRYNKPEPDVTTEQRVADAVLASPQTIFQTSMLSGLADLMASLSGKGGGIEAVGRTLGSIPANLVIPYNRLLQQIDQTFDPKTYDTNVVAGGVPFVRRMGNEINDVQGRPQTYSPSDRFGSSESKDTVDRLLLDKNLAIPEIGRDVKVGNRNMTEDEHDQYRKISGQRIRVRLQSIEPRLRGMTREKAQDEIERISREERNRVKSRIVSRAPLATAAK